MGCRDRIANHRVPANQSPIVLWTFSIDPWPSGPLPDEYDLLIDVNHDNRPQLLEPLSEVFLRHMPIHYGRYRRQERFEVAR